MSKRRAEHVSIRGRLGQVLAWSTIAAVVLVLAVMVLVPRLAGATPFTILTGSMEPGMPPGTLVVVKPVDVDEITVGDVITYQLESGRPTVVTHRVVARGVDLTGETVLTTQGDANDVPDEASVREVQVRGERWYSVPHLGRLNTLLSDRQRESAVVVAVVALLGYAATQFIGATRERRKTSRSTPNPEGAVR